MQFFIDTANINEIKQAKALGLLDGVTTNPSLIAKTKLQTGRKFRDIGRVWWCARWYGYTRNGATTCIY